MLRLNKYIAQATGLSRRAADKAIEAGLVQVNGSAGELAQQVGLTDSVTLNGQLLSLPEQHATVLLNKPPGYVCSRDGQGSKTIYELLPTKLHSLKPIGRLDKHSSGLLLLTEDGQLAHALTHPKFQKTKVYKIALNKPLAASDAAEIQKGVALEDGLSKLELTRINRSDDVNWKVTMSEGRNRQIRRTFEALGYSVVKLHRTHFGPYTLNDMSIGNYRSV